MITFKQRIKDLFFIHNKSISQIRVIMKIPYKKNQYTPGVSSKEFIQILGFSSFKEYNEFRRKQLQQQRYKSGYTKARKKALERDKYQCVLSGKTTHLHVHHIDGKRTHNSLKNLVTLTDSCHTKLHSNRPPPSLLNDYQKWLRKNGYPKAKWIHCKECNHIHWKNLKDTREVTYLGIRGIEDYDAQPPNKNRSGEEMQISEGCGLKSK